MELLGYWAHQGDGRVAEDRSSWWNHATQTRDLNPRAGIRTQSKSGWGLEPSFLFEITHLFSGLNEAQVLNISLLKEFSERDFPGSLVVKNLPSNAGDMGWTPGWGTEIPCAAGQLSLCAATRGDCTPQWRARTAKGKTQCNKVTGKWWVYLERKTPHRLNRDHLRSWEVLKYGGGWFLWSG